MQFYFANLMVHHLLRVAPADHPIIKTCEKLIDKHLKIDRSFLKQDIVERIMRRNKKSTRILHKITGLNAPSPFNDTELERQVARSKEKNLRENLHLPEQKKPTPPKQTRFKQLASKAQTDFKRALSEAGRGAKILAQYPILMRLTKRWKTSAFVRWAAWEQVFDHHGAIHLKDAAHYKKNLPHTMQALLDAVYEDWHQAVGSKMRPQRHQPH
ncbi:MAG: hypothetical protein KGQ41_06110 [Alphaproteobacteria bacterium]|nr:hypothetical protein [Alphaproteobacteria bacterium]